MTAATVATSVPGRCVGRPFQTPRVIVKCTHCDSADLETGFIFDSGQGPRYGRWASGQLKLGSFGGAEHAWNIPKRQIDAYRCPQCGHLELSSTGEIEY